MGESLIVRDSTFAGNQTKNISNSTNNTGGGIYLSLTSRDLRSVIIEETNFKDNTSFIGDPPVPGHIFILGSQSAAGQESVYVIDSTKTIVDQGVGIVMMDIVMMDVGFQDMVDLVIGISEDPT